MSDLANYKIVFASVGKSLKNKPQDVAHIISSTFNIKLEEVLKVVNQSPIVLFEGLSVRDVSRMQNAVIFLTKIGIEITITPEKCSRLSTTNWKLTHTPPIAACPSCGDTFILLNSNTFLPHSVSQEKPIHSKPPAPIEGAISAEFEEIEGLSAELESIVQMDDDSAIEEIEEIEEIGSVSQELEEMGSFSEELEKIGDLAEELEELSNNEKLSPHHASRIEEIEGISAEFEEIEGVSAEFERICMEDMEDIGSLSAELEEIEGISAEFEKISEDNIEKLDHSDFGNFAESALDDDIESISAELEKIAEPVMSNEPEPLKSEESFTQLFMSNEKKKERPPQPSSLVIQPGVYDVIININPRGNVTLANKTISKLLQMKVEKVAAITQKHSAVTVAKKVSKDTAQAILQQFFKYKMSGHIKINKLQ
ncbi:hypothetical protein [Candidatus Uabimicrobium sp. HlEnr_7]|uniref:hypothetical protein n=1 Tax=Candidatus Uabimicrobium helgolandensis TaxID=3095367 RepID=UPI003557266C